MPLGTRLSEFHSGYRAYRISELAEYRLNRLGFGTSRWVSWVTEYDLKEGDGSSHSAILDMLAGRTPSRVLDLGCSGGLLAERVRKLGHQVVGAEVVELPGVRDRVDEFHLVDLAAVSLRIWATTSTWSSSATSSSTFPILSRRCAGRRRCCARPARSCFRSPFGHWYPRVRVPTGLFGYDHRGILDETLLRFFTRRSLLRFVFVLRLRPHVESTHVSVYPTERAAAANQA